MFTAVDQRLVPRRRFDADPYLVFVQMTEQLIEGRTSPETRKAYRADRDSWVHFCRAEGLNPLEPTLVAAQAFRDVRRAGFAPASVRRTLAVISSLYRQLMRDGPVRQNPFHPAVLSWPPSSKAGRTPRIPREVAEAMIEAAVDDVDRFRGARDAAVLRLLWDTGLRRMSIATLRRASIQERDGRPVLWDVQIKGDRTGMVWPPVETLDAIDRWLALAPDSPFVFPGKDPNRHVGLTMINKIVRLRGEEVGCSDAAPHQFRAAFITDALDAGQPQFQVQASVHHRNASTTAMYDRGVRGGDVAGTVADWRRGR